MIGGLKRNRRKIALGPMSARTHGLKLRTSRVASIAVGLSRVSRLGLLWADEQEVCCSILTQLRAGCSIVC